MYNNPNQNPQPPYGSGLPSYVPQPGFNAPQQPRKSRRWLWIILGIVAVLLFACVGGSFVIFNMVAHSPATDVVNKYYTALKDQDYSTAYQYLDSNNMKLTGLDTGADQQITQELFTTTGQGIDKTKGTVSSYNITNTALNSNNGLNTADFTVNVTRNGTSYDAHLHLEQEGNNWKIISFDNL